MGLYNLIKMVSPLLRTRLYFPAARPERVFRPRLVERLEAGLQGALTLVSAPAGYGKTTLLAEWRAGAGRETPAAWLSLDAGDNDPARFLQYLSAALEGLQEGLLENTQALLQATQIPPQETILTVLLNELAAFPEDFVLVLDDYHWISEQAVHAALDFLLEHLPPIMHLVLLTRADPPLPLARLRARGQLTEIRAQHLRFTAAETTKFLAGVMRLQLEARHIARLETRIEGWPAGLHLAALSMQGLSAESLSEFVEAFAGGHQYILDYLVDEVLNRLSESEQDFLRKTCLLERLTGALCDAMTGYDDGRHTLEALQQANIFISPLDDTRKWYRYHPLLASVLQNRLRAVEPHSLPLLHRKAAEWLDANGLIEEAIRHAQASGDSQYLGRLLIRHADHLFNNENRSTLQRWFESLPVEMIATDPRLGVRFAQLLWSLGRRTGLEAYLHRAEQALQADEESGKIAADPGSYALVAARIRSLQSMAATEMGAYDRAVALAEQTLALAPADAHEMRAYALIGLSIAYREMGYFDEALQASREAIPEGRQSGRLGLMLDAYAGAGQTLQVKGLLNQAAEVYLEGIRYAESVDRARMFQYALVYVELANVYYAWNDLAKAEAYLEKGLQLSEQGGRKLVTQYGRVYQARLLRAKGETRRALALLEQVDFETRQAGISAISVQVNALMAHFRAELGLEAPASLLEDVGLQTGERIGYRQAIRVLQSARGLLALGRWQPALDLARDLGAAADRCGCLSWQVEALAMQAAAAYRLGEASGGLDLLCRALALAEPQRQVRTFLDLGEPLGEMLRVLQRQMAGSAFVAELVTASGVHGGAALPGQGLSAPLSERELEVLRLIAAGCSNQEIAERLVLALGTVKRHTSNIFNKLDVDNRTAAVARARELDLLH